MWAYFIFRRHPTCVDIAVLIIDPAPDGKRTPPPPRRQKRVKENDREGEPEREEREREKREREREDKLVKRKSTECFQLSLRRHRGTP